MNRADLAHVALALVPGVGRARFDALMGRFGCVEAVLAASQDELTDVRRVSTANATAIRQASLGRAEAVVERTERLGGHVLERYNGTVPVLCRCRRTARGVPSMCSTRNDALVWTPTTHHKGPDGRLWHTPYFVGMLLS